MRLSREAVVLGIVLLMLLAFSLFSSAGAYQQELSALPTSVNTAAAGYAALTRLLATRGIPGGGNAVPLTSLTARAGLVVVSEPLVRQLTSAEDSTVVAWIKRGGTLLLVRSAAADAGAQVSLTGPHLPTVREFGSPGRFRPQGPARFLRDVATVQVDGDAVLTEPEAPHTSAPIRANRVPLLEDTTYGNGHILTVASSLGAGNLALQRADNAVLYCNIIEFACGPNRLAALIDDYHQGIGDEVTDSTWWDLLGARFHMAVLAAAVLLLLMLFSLNQRFGSVIQLSPPVYRPSTEYISSVGGLYERAGATGVVLEVLSHDFVRDLARALGVTADVGVEELAALAAKAYGVDAAELSDALQRCVGAMNTLHGSQTEMVAIARQLNEFRRRMQIAGS